MCEMGELDLSTLDLGGRQGSRYERLLPAAWWPREWHETVLGLQRLRQQSRPEVER